LNNASFDSGEQTYQAIAGAATLPPGTMSIFTAGSLNNQVVAFAYGLGAGLVYHSSLWLDWYVDFSSSQVGTLMRTVYAPNVIEYAAAYTASGPPTILASPENFTATTDGEARFTVSARGQPVLRYQWLFNGTPLPNATNYSLHLSNISSNDAGIYSAIVSNNLGSQTSAGATASDRAPSDWANLTPACSVTARVLAASVGAIIAPLSPMARAKSPFASGDATCALTDDEPADSPAMVTRRGSPPNAATLSRTQRSAAVWSISE
jgi:hypothetical protein